MAKGTVQETGTHGELLQRGGLYTKLYHTQFQLAQFEPLPTS
ncbi:MAG: hypothetical protein R3B74_07920 [Nitrospirales bacterium]